MKIKDNTGKIREAVPGDRIQYRNGSLIQIAENGSHRIFPKVKAAKDVSPSKNRRRERRASLQPSSIIAKQAEKQSQDLIDLMAPFEKSQESTNDL